MSGMSTTRCVNHGPMRSPRLVNCHPVSKTVLQKGRLRTKYIDPVYEDQVLITCARITSVVENGEGETVHGLEVWCEDDTGKRVTVGDALVYSTRP